MVTGTRRLPLPYVEQENSSGGSKSCQEDGGLVSSGQGHNQEDFLNPLS